MALPVRLPRNTRQPRFSGVPMIRPLLIITAAGIVLAATLLAWHNMPNADFPADGRHAPKPINQNWKKR
jgi:hypothetical protein